MIPPAPLRRAFAACWLAACLGACGREAPAASAEPWPLTLEQPGVAGYVAARFAATERDQLFQGLVGGAPQGLDAAHPLVLLYLDSQVFGGSCAVLLPVADEQAFLASLAGLPGVQAGPRGEYVLEPGHESGLGRLMLLASGLRGATSMLDVFRALQSLGPPRLAFHARVQDGTALLAPTFEAGSACAEVLRATRAFRHDPPRGLVASFDLERLRTVHAEDIARLEDQLRGLAGGARAAGLAGMFGRMGRGGEAEGLPFLSRVNWDVVWALKEMLAADSLAALQVQLDLPSAEVVADGAGRNPVDTLFGALDGLQGLEARVRFEPGSRWQALVATLRPAPDLPGAALLLRADGPAFARAFAEWLRPLAEVVQGRGAPCDRYVDELASILGGFGGTLALHLPENGAWSLLADAGAAPPDALSRLSAWVAPLLVALRLEDAAGALGVREEEDGRLQLVGADGGVGATLGRSGEVLWLQPGAADEAPAASADLVRVLSAPVPPGAPALRVTLPWGDAEARAEDGELHLQLRRRDDG